MRLERERNIPVYRELRYERSMIMEREKNTPVHLGTTMCEIYMRLERERNIPVHLGTTICEGMMKSGMVLSGTGTSTATSFTLHLQEICICVRRLSIISA
jgi:hypothetical protein